MCCAQKKTQNNNYCSICLRLTSSRIWSNFTSLEEESSQTGQWPEGNVTAWRQVDTRSATLSYTTLTARCCHFLHTLYQLCWKSLSLHEKQVPLLPGAFKIIPVFFLFLTSPSSPLFTQQWVDRHLSLSIGTAYKKNAKESIPDAWVKVEIKKYCSFSLGDTQTKTVKSLINTSKVAAIFTPRGSQGSTYRCPCLSSCISL